MRSDLKCGIKSARPGHFCLETNFNSEKREFPSPIGLHLSISFLFAVWRVRGVGFRGQPTLKKYAYVKLA